MKKTFLLLQWRLLMTAIVAFFSLVNAFAQTPLTGKVTDSSGIALERVSVKVKGTLQGVYTSSDGSFSLQVSPTQTLVFTSVGFASREIVVGSQKNIMLSLSRTTDLLQDVVVVGYTQQTKAKNTAAISKLNADELKNTTSPNPVQALQGKIAGLSVPVITGQPGASATNLIIRGGTKLNAYGSGLGNSGGSSVGSSDATSPLVVIDGVFRSMADVNPDNIESIQVMKDAASTAIYGARGANGVIVIKTKGGKYNSKMNVTLNHRSTSETVSRHYDYMNALQYLTLARTTVKNTFDPIDKNNLLNNGGFSAGTRLYSVKGQYGTNINLTALYDNIVAIEGIDYVNKLLANGYSTMDDPINPGTKLLYADNHYQDLIWKKGMTQNNNISIDGGSDKANYNLAVNSVDQAGTFIGTNYKRTDILGNFGFKVADNFRLEAMVNYQNITPNYVEAYQNEITRGTRVTPLIRVFKDNGDPMPGELYSARNRLHTLKYDDTRVSTERIVTRLAGDLNILKGLHFKPSISYLVQDYRFLFMRKGTPTDEVQPSTQRQKSETSNNSRQLMIDQLLQYDFKIETNHHVYLLGGFNFTRNTANNINIGSQRATNDYIFTINEPSTGVIAGVTTTNVTDFGTTLSESKSASYFGQFNYDYNGKYLISGALRYDGFSNFAPENKYALFPSGSLGWNIHKENFWKIKAFNSMKLRASLGTVGSSDLSITDTYGGYSATSYALGSGILRSNLSNPNLKWESTTQFDIGFDAGFFNNRVTLTMDYYNKLTQNRLASKPLPSEAPFPTITFNNGELRNRGFEIELGATIIKAKNFNWKTNFVFALNKQLVTKLPSNSRDKNRQGGDVIYDPVSKSLVEAGGIAEGERPYGIWAYQTAGVFATDAEAAAWNAKIKDNLASPGGITAGKHAGDFIFVDVNGDGIIDTKDQVFQGYRTPDKTGGMQNTFVYKGFTLRFTLDFAAGHIISNGALARSLGQGRAFNEGAPMTAIGDDIWQKSGDAGKTYARFSFADFDFGQRNYLRLGTLGINNSYASDVSTMYAKGDFIAFRELSIAYDLPLQLVKKIHSTGLNIFASVYNLGYLTKYKGLNPETYTGFDDGGYPRPRQFSIGATLKF